MRFEVAHNYVYVNGIRMHYVTAGQGPPVVLLHGFPEFWYGWRHQIPALSEHFTVIAPDLRGYNETEKPTWGYTADVLTSDVRELITTLGYERAHVIGHDWGGALAWLLAITAPQRVERLAVLNMPHPLRFWHEIRHNRAQQLRSWYMGLFQLPWLPEALFRANDYALLKMALRGTRPDALTPADVEAYKAAASQPGALTAMLSWYRSLNWRAAQQLERQGGHVAAPTLLIWGTNDHALGTELAANTQQFVPNLRTKYIENCSHWVQHDYPDLVTTYLLEFLCETC